MVAGQPVNYFTTSEWTNPDVDLKKNELKILHIGNSYTDDQTYLLPKIARASGADLSGLHIYKTYRGSGSFRFWLNIIHGEDSTGSYKITNVLGDDLPGVTAGSFKGNDSVPMLKLLTAVDWDIIVLQQSSAYSTDYDSWFNSGLSGGLTELLQLLRTMQPNAAIGYTLIHSYWQGNAANKEKSTLLRWMHLSQTVTRFQQDYDIDFIIPYGTAVENLRSTSLNTAHDLTRDGTHLGHGLARYAAACAYYQSIIAPRTGVSVLGNTARYACTRSDTTEGTIYPDGCVDVTRFNAPIAQRAACLAVNYPKWNLNPERVGDMNGDTRVTMADVTTLINSVLQGNTSLDSMRVYHDVNFDKSITPDDVNQLIDNILGNDAQDAPKFQNPALDVTKDSLRVLLLGDQNFIHGTSMLSSLANATRSNVQDMCIYKATRYNGSYKWWLDKINGADTTTSYYVSKVLGGLDVGITAGTYATSQSIREILDKQWDLIVISQFAYYATEYNSWLYHQSTGYLDEYIEKLREYQPDATIGFLLSPSYWDNYKLNMKGSSLESWADMAHAAMQLGEGYNIDFVIPMGTAIENLRTTSLNNEYDLTMNGVDLGYGLARYVASACFYQSLIAPRSGVDVEGNTWRRACTDAEMTNTTYPSSFDVTDENALIAQRSAMIAVAHPFENINPDPRPNCDVNGDGIVSIADANIIIYILLYGNEPLTDDVVATADVNQDGQITIADASVVVAAVLNN